MTALIELDRAGMVFDTGAEKIRALEPMDLSIGTGQFLAVVGPSGCGKSTLMRLLTGLTRASEGEIRIGGDVLSGPARDVGMAFQNASLMPWRTTLDNILISFEVSPHHRHAFARDRAPFIATATALLAEVGLADFVERYPWELSGGMQQRVNVCRSIVHAPRLLMLDEPFAALDAFTREALWAIMQRLWIERGFTAVLITHDLREAVYLADEVIVMSARPGRILHRSPIDLPRPRTLDMTFTDAFQAHVHALRERIQTEHESP
jgi:NitT/TauT family transport system ATP-binding protein